MQFDVLIRGGTLVASHACAAADLGIRAGRIAAIGEELPRREAAQVIEAQGRYVLPGAVDGHIHLMDPGFTQREDATSGSLAAARGGVTTLIDHHRSDPQVFTAEILAEKRRYFEDKMHVDFALMGGLNLTNAGALRAMWEAGAVCFKGFTCFLHGAEALLPGSLKEIMTEVRRFDGLVQLHCEEDSILRANESRLKREGRRDPLSVAEYRSRDAERIAAANAVDMAQLTGCRLIVAHVSQPDILQRIAAARAADARVYAESCGQYFILDESDLEEKGPYAKFTPPVRSAAEVAGMWRALARGAVDMVNSDHCPLTRAEKESGREDIWKAAFGIPGVETTTRILLDGVAAGRIDIRDVVRVRCENPARIYGLDHRKGFLLPGYDADLVIVDTAAEETLSDDAVVSKCGWTPLAGRRLRGDVLTTLVRGRVVMDERDLVGPKGWGEFVTRAGLEARPARR
jgi:dihydroorotase (multifunctional complex type)